ncbi:hypothetical protein LCGC14_1815790 [marine sediment metagenome]|uniref:Lysozyme n=1 Tax=marine sediment metagenome TaxID=412755 RepID=A0A0F9JK28_9ZZZZ
MAFDRARLEDHVKRAEAPNGEAMLFPYEDSVGLITIGWGRNLDGKGLSLKECQLLFDNDLQDVFRDCATLPFWDHIDGVRQMVVMDMVFNLGLTRFLKFKNLNRALTIQDYVRAAHEMLDSKWYRQVGRRAEKLRQIMLTGVWKDA